MAKITGIIGSTSLTKRACWHFRSSFPRRRSRNIFRYHFGNLHDKDGVPNPREAWTFGIDERLFQQLRAQGVTTRQRYGLLGHSAGGQYVHRMLSFGFRDHVAVAVSANAGTYAMPDLSIPWPFGLGETDLDNAHCASYWPFHHGNGRH